MNQDTYKATHKWQCLFAISSDVTVKEEVLALMALKETTRGVEHKNVPDRTLTNADVPLNNLVNVTTDGALAMGGIKI